MPLCRAEDTQQKTYPFWLLHPSLAHWPPPSPTTRTRPCLTDCTGEGLAVKPCVSSPVCAQLLSRACQAGWQTSTLFSGPFLDPHHGPLPSIALHTLAAVSGWCLLPQSGLCQPPHLTSAWTEGSLEVLSWPHIKPGDGFAPHGGGRNL